MNEEEGAVLTEQPEPTFTFNDREYTQSELAELVNKGEDYTRKTQDLARQKQEVEPLAQIMQAWNHPDPTTRDKARREVALFLAQEAGVSIPQQNSMSNQQGTQPENWDEMTVGERALYQRNLALEQRLSQVTDQLGQLHQGYQQTAQQQQQEYLIGSAVKSLADSGYQATPEQVRAAVMQTGIHDPEAAFLKANKATLAAARVSREKPDAAGSGPKTFDPTNMEASEIIRRMTQGETPIK